jgi:3-deoxy-D-manno-octulosonic acid (KDO) 8-phosphate synthase
MIYNRILLVRLNKVRLIVGIQVHTKISQVCQCRQIQKITFLLNLSTFCCRQFLLDYIVSKPYACISFHERPKN